MFQIQFPCSVFGLFANGPCPYLVLDLCAEDELHGRDLGRWSINSSALVAC